MYLYKLNSIYMNVNCEYCQKEFETSNPRKKCCSKSCADKNSKAKRIVQTLEPTIEPKATIEPKEKKKPIEQTTSLDNGLPKLYKVSELSKYFGLSIHTVYSLIKEHNIKTINFGERNTRIYYTAKLVLSTEAVTVNAYRRWSVTTTPYNQRLHKSVTSIITT